MIMGFGVNKRVSFVYRNVNVILFIILGLFIISIDTVNRYFALLELNDLQESRYYYIFRIIIFSFIFISIFFDKTNVSKKFHITYLFYLFILICSFSIFINSLNFVDLFKGIIYTFSFALIFRFALLYSTTNNNISPIITTIVCLIIVVMLQFLNTYVLQKNIIAIISNDAIFSLIVFAPFLFLLKNKKLVVFLLILMLMFTVFSQKRSAIISLSLSVIIAINIYFINVSKIKVIIGTFSFIILSFLIVRRIGESEYVSAIVNRFNNDGDNGRNTIIDNSLNQFYSSDNLIDFLFGFGYAATTKNNGIPIHNDFLEILYDFGIFAFLIYCLIIVHLGIKCVRWFKYRLKFMKFYLSYVVAYVMLVILSFFNSMFFSLYPTVLFFSLGLSYGYITFKLQNRI